MSEDRVEALRKALELTPENQPLRAMLAETLEASGKHSEALAEYAMLVGSGQIPAGRLVPLGELALASNRIELAARFLEEAKRTGCVEGVTDLQKELDKRLSDKKVLRMVPRGPERAGIREPDSFLDKQDAVAFSDVGGLESVKKTIHRMIIMPLRRPELYEKYGRKSGGGVMMYGPPGCGKTLLARATAGECGLPFFNIRIEEILDPWMGVSEKNLHESFERARELAPCVAFLDELDALAFARRKQHGSSSRALVDQLLQELDSIGADNRNLLILAATNAPWDVDEALKRPGRFDRLIFVPPPDREARQRILELLTSDKPTTGLDLGRVANETALFSGADLKAVVDRAVDEVIEEALETGDEKPVDNTHIEKALEETRPSTLDWLETARNYVEFANQGERYADVAGFLRTREIAIALKKRK